MAIGSNSMASLNDGPDYLKISNLTVTQRASVPEPSMLALIGIAAVALVTRRRKVEARR